MSKLGTSSVQGPLSPSEFVAWNRVAERMDVFHDHFRHMFKDIWDSVEGLDNPGDRRLSRILATALELNRYLEFHHGIEETYFFPLLARKMPQFAQNGTHLQEHAEMHASLERYVAYIEEVREDPSKWSPAKMHTVMKGFEAVLFKHLDDEVASLGAQSMRAAGWTLKEIKAFQM